MQNTSTTFQLDRATLLPLADQLAESFQNARPFPHIVTDGVFPEELLDAVLAEYPEPEDVPWQSFASPSELKLALADTENMGPATRHLLAELNGQVFVDFLERLTGITSLIPDPHYEGGGLHQIRRDGFLKVHADFNRHGRLPLDRRLNVLLYLNRDWPEDFGGHLELWDKTMTNCAARVLPTFNRMVVFATTDFAYHGHPDPLTCPQNRARRSMALYYYTNGRPASEVSYTHTTLFRARPDEQFARSRQWQDIAARWAPPAVYDAARRMQDRIRQRRRPDSGG
jgi:Rps23 Pro-64 3,4-dihydroxylase Tpa1-like proline 4-hydroxylase